LNYKNKISARMQIRKKKKMLGKYDMHMIEMQMPKSKIWDVTNLTPLR
jgi:hypothetical protein